ncbi:MAG TPA: hypothetical protein VGF75_02280 [Candidatus Saccharimonadales bacterium]|jgi:hypothetical protein
MLKTLRNKIIIVVATLTLATPMLVPLTANANCSGIGSAVATGASDTTNGQNGNGSMCGTGSGVTGTVETLATKVVNLFSIVVGIIAVVMIIYAGFRYITSGGESGSVSSAKNTLLFAIIGIIIVVLAQLIVHFVLNSANGIANPSATGGL